MPDLAIVLVVVLVLVLLWRGPKTLPKLGEALGRGVREARDAASDDDRDRDLDRTRDGDRDRTRPPAEDDRRV
jgi:Sec-independent protein translocase protein TatA